MNMYFPSRRHVASLLLNTKHLGSLKITLSLSISPIEMWVFSPPRDMIKLWCDLSLPLWHQFPRRALLDMWYKWVGPWVTEQSSMSNMMLVEDKNHRVELEQICRMQMANCLLNIEIGNTELFSSVAPKWFGLTESGNPVCLSSTQRQHFVTSAH